jgi:alkanesulfonate monooxygenase SsuD/methylene tetrahydromethanopterin reductase-like flavin-dependent oxidoreductase (luciferase family)
MDFGIMLGDQPTTVAPRDHFESVLRQVEAAQRSGINHIVMGQHFLFRESRWLQPIPLLARLAAEVDADSRLVTQIMVAPLYPPVILAEELATLDIVTEGRLIVGLGLGYRPEEFKAMGVPFSERVARLEECVAVLKAMWTNDRVTFDGSFCTLTDDFVHIRPVQDPRPPIWIGAHSEIGVRRAARIGDAWPITPQEPVDEIGAWLKIFVDERTRLGLPVGRQPLRREIVVGTDRADAKEKAIKMARRWYLHMAEIGTLKIKQDQALASMEGALERGFVLGDAEDCANQLRAIGDRLPVNPIITRASWPGMTTDDAVSYIETLGKELVPSLRDYHSSPVLLPS